MLLSTNQIQYCKTIKCERLFFNLQFCIASLQIPPPSWRISKRMLVLWWYITGIWLAETDRGSIELMNNEQRGYYRARNRDEERMSERGSATFFFFFVLSGGSMGLTHERQFLYSQACQLRLSSYNLNSERREKTHYQHSGNNNSFISLLYINIHFSLLFLSPTKKPFKVSSRPSCAWLNLDVSLDVCILFYFNFHFPHYLNFY